MCALHFGQPCLQLQTLWRNVHWLSGNLQIMPVLLRLPLMQGELAGQKRTLSGLTGDGTAKKPKLEDSPPGVIPSSSMAGGSSQSPGVSVANAETPMQEEAAAPASAAQVIATGGECQPARAVRFFSWHCKAGLPLDCKD